MLLEIHRNFFTGIDRILAVAYFKSQQVFSTLLEQIRLGFVKVNISLRDLWTWPFEYSVHYNCLSFWWG